MEGETKTVTEGGDGTVLGEKELLEGGPEDAEPISKEVEELLLEGVSGLEMGDRKMEGIESGTGKSVVVESGDTSVKSVVVESGVKSVESSVQSVVVPVSVPVSSVLVPVSSVSVSSVVPVASGVSYAGVVSSQGAGVVSNQGAGVVSSQGEQSLEGWLKQVFMVERRFRQSSMVKECLVKERVSLSERVVDRVFEKFGSRLIAAKVWGQMTYFEREKVKEKRIRGSLKRACQKEQKEQKMTWKIEIELKEMVSNFDDKMCIEEDKYNRYTR